MFVLLEGIDRDLLENLHDLLLRHGIETLLSEAGGTPEGQPRLILVVVLDQDMAEARALLYRSPQLLNELQPEHLQRFLQLRREPRQRVLDWLSSPAALGSTGLTLALLLLGLFGEKLLS